MLLLSFLIVIVVGAALRLSVQLYHRRRIAAELRGDWWPRFEREFRAYASRSWAAAREAERRPGSIP